MLVSTVMDSTSHEARRDGGGDGGLLCDGVTDTGIESGREVFDVLFVKSMEGDALLEGMSEKQGMSGLVILKFVGR